MKADAAARREDMKAKIDKRADQLDAKAAAKDADWAEQDAATPSTTPSGWSRRPMAMLDALDARIDADERPRPPACSSTEAKPNLQQEEMSGPGAILSLTMIMIHGRIIHRMQPTRYTDAASAGPGIQSHALHMARLGDLHGPSGILRVGDRDRVGDLAPSSPGSAFSTRRPANKAFAHRSDGCSCSYSWCSTATLFGSLEAIRENGGQLAAVLLTVGLAVSLLPILLGSCAPFDATQPRTAASAAVDHAVGLFLFAAVVLLLMLVG